MKRIDRVAVVVGLGAAMCGCARPPAAPTEPAAAHQQAAGPAAPSAEPEVAAAEPPAASAAAAVPDIRAQCALEVRRQIACVDHYIPMIVDVRIKLDLPPGTADKGRDEAGRAALMVLAREEFPDYYSEEKIPEICDKRQAMAERMPPELRQELTALGPDCHSAESCEGWARCTSPMVERILAMQARAGGR